MGKFRFGVSLRSIDGRDKWIRKCRRAEELGYDVITVPDHLGAPSPLPALAAAAAVTERPRLGPLVMNVPVVTDNQIPVNGGAGTNQDSVIVGRFPDAWFWEDNVKAEAFPATFASNLSLFLRLYSYIALQPARYPKSFSVISGTGLVAPVL
jgi:hypothetical protein